MTTREELDLQLVEFDLRRAAADAQSESVLARWEQATIGSTHSLQVETIRNRSSRFLRAWGALARL